MAANGMKIGAVIVGGPLSIVGLWQASKMYRNYTQSEEDNMGALVAGHTRDRAVVERLIAGENLKNFSAKHLEKHLKTNSALGTNADEIRKAHAKVHGLPEPETKLSAIKSPSGKIKNLKTASAP